MHFRVALFLLLMVSVPVLAGPKFYQLPAGAASGKPNFELLEKVVGYSLWTDREGFHLRWTTDGKPYLFSGRIDFDKPLGEIKRVRKETGGWARAHGDQVVRFSTTSRGEVDGLDLVIPGGRRAFLDLKIDGADPTVEQVSVGAKADHPKGFPLMVYLR